jgi:hypothetical protein
LATNAEGWCISTGRRSIGKATDASTVGATTIACVLTASINTVSDRQYTTTGCHAHSSWRTAVNSSKHDSFW